MILDLCQNILVKSQIHIDEIYRESCTKALLNRVFLQAVCFKNTVYTAKQMDV